MPVERLSISELKREALEIRKDIINMLAVSKSGHAGGSLSATDILTVLYFNTMNHNPEEPKWQDRDRFVLSKGHAAPALYAALARSGYFPAEELMTLRKLTSRLQGHPSMADLPCLESSSGSLGQGLSISIGMALSARLDKKEYSVFCLMGDGEQQEGSIWESVMCAAQYKLDNLCAIIDDNRLQLSGITDRIMKVDPIAKKYKAFGWKVIKVNGHHIPSLLYAFRRFRKMKGRGKPVLVLANTIKGKGVSFMENQADWHGKAPNKEEAEQAIKELSS